MPGLPICDEHPRPVRLFTLSGVSPGDILTLDRLRELIPPPKVSQVSLLREIFSLFSLSNGS